MKNPYILNSITNLSSSKKDLIIIIFLAFIVFILSTIFNFFNLILVFISQHNSWQMDDLIVICIFLVLVLVVFSYRRSMEMKQEIYKKIEAEHALLNANNKLNLLSSITRHDIKNQLQVLSAYLEMSKESLGDHVRTLEFIAKEEKVLDIIALQISFTKDYEDMGVKAPLWQNVNMVIRKVLTQLPVWSICVSVDDPNLEMFADSLLEKVFYNLTDNALRYGGEKITSIRVISREDKGSLVITVEDDGNGISIEDKKQLFTKGFGKHTGLGLYLSREILSITGITINETGEPGKGARFEITVPKGLYRFTAVK